MGPRNKIKDSTGSDLTKNEASLKSDEQALAEIILEEDLGSETAAPKLPNINMEQREFSRVPLIQKPIEIEFKSCAQFAKQYIDNISLGGLFVKTQERPPLGSIVAISFSLPATPSLPEREFNLYAKVCRISESGIALEFTNLTLEARAELEVYVKNFLPKGVDTRTKAKQSTVDRLQQIRARKDLIKRRLKKILKSSLVIGLLLIINAYLGLRSYLEYKGNTKATDNSAWVEIEGVKIQRKEIRGLQMQKDGRIVLRTSSGSEIDITDPASLPYDLRQSANTLKSLPAQKPSRRSKNSRNLTRIAHH
ncbi:MAG: hypothetical protein COV44_11020 [Deltaproteobacteria bacterium CG11_big_fil_rev_8_21_14_0_20_45_16]|nr:MAG: hypothetical protein COV44_11020 [Deltaproteobacteria bacterium CG11_big_fil_rev_8_21_14_0_20_45_16]